MRKVIYCSCGWAGTTEQLEQEETVNNDIYKVCPKCGTHMLSKAMEVHEETFKNILDEQRQALDDLEIPKEED